MFLHGLFQFLLWPLALLGAITLILGLMLASPLRSPPPLELISTGARAISVENMPERSRFQGRDGTWLAYRLYPARNGGKDRLVVLAHGSSAASEEMNAAAHALADSGVNAVAIDARGHGASGMRGDIAFIGQTDGDMEDLVAELRKTFPQAKLTLAGHSSGGGFALRIASGRAGGLFERFILLAPYLGFDAPTTRPSEGGAYWAQVDIPRILAILILRSAGIDWAQSLPVIAFANQPGIKTLTSRYSYRLLADYGPPRDMRAAFVKLAGKVEVIAGEQDQLMDAQAYKTLLEPLGVSVTLTPGVDHMGVVYRPEALAALVAAVKR